MTVFGKSSINESVEKREVNSERKNKHEEPIYEDVTVIERVTERTLLAKNVFVSIQAKHNLALRAEFMTSLDLTLNDCQTVTS